MLRQEVEGVPQELNTEGGLGDCQVRTQEKRDKTERKRKILTDVVITQSTECEDGASARARWVPQQMQANSLTLPHSPSLSCTLTHTHRHTRTHTHSLL